MKQARFYSPGRPYGVIRQIVIHDAEIAELADSAERLQQACAFWDRQASWHYAVDTDTICQSVLDSDRAWCAGPGNDFGLHFELAGRYNQTREAWLDDYSLAMLRLAAPFIAAKCQQYDVPIRWLTIPEMVNNDRGIVSHHTISLASQWVAQRKLKLEPWYRLPKGWRTTNHIDPGSYFPHAEFLAMIEACLR
jgi:N-acetyl-anhydromuramyl-L-alanine amidase AmpD